MTDFSQLQNIGEPEDKMEEKIVVVNGCLPLLPLLCKILGAFDVYIVYILKQLKRKLCFKVTNKILNLI